MKFDAKVNHADARPDEAAWVEVVEAGSGGTAEDARANFQSTLDFFNGGLRSNERPRVLLGISEHVTTPREAWQEGYAAYNSGVEEDANPYDYETRESGLLADNWSDGWNAAEDLDF